MKVWSLSILPMLTDGSGLSTADLDNVYGGDALFLRSPENVASGFKNGLFGIDEVKRYLAVLRIYSRVDLMDQTLVLLAGQYEFEFDYLKKTRVIMHRLKSHLNHSSIGLRVITQFARLWNPNARVHLIY